MVDVKRPLAKSRNSLYGLFVKFKAAFDLAHRDKVILTLVEAVVPMDVLKLLAADI